MKYLEHQTVGAISMLPRIAQGTVSDVDQVPVRLALPGQRLLRASTPSTCFTTTLILLRGKALSLSVYTLYDDPADLEWIKHHHRALADELQAPQRALSAMPCLVRYRLAGRPQEVKNAVEQTNKEVTNRFDFKGSDARVELGRLVLTVYADDEFKLGQVLDVLRTRLAKRNVDMRALEPGAVEKISGDKVKRPVTVKVGVAAGKGQADPEADQGLEAQGRGLDPGRRGAGLRREEGRPAGGDPAGAEVGRRPPAAVHQLPRLRSFRPAVVDPVGDLVQSGQARLEVLFDFARRLHAGLAVPRDLVGAAALQPVCDQLRGHLDVALHAEVPAERERLVRAVLALEHARRARRDAEGLAVPLEGLEAPAASPSHSRATPLSATRTSPQPISRTGFARTVPPKAPAT